MKRIITLVLVVAMICCLFTGCGKKEPVNDPDAEETKAPAVSDVVTGTFNPLTGEEVDEDMSAMRPYCVMINNHHAARPSIGLSNASIIYEVLVEGSITRLMAIFNDVDGLDIGNIRSCRPYYVSLAQAYDAIYIHWGGSKQGYSDIKTYGVDDLDALTHGSGCFYRNPNLTQNEHNALVHGTKAAAYAAENYGVTHDADYNTGYNLYFSKDAASQCPNESKDFTVFFFGYAGGSNTSTNFKYDEDKGCYNAYMSGKEYVDRNGGVSIDLANVIILNVPTKTIDGKGHQQMELTGSGTGFFATGGKYVEINWERPTREDCFQYTLTDGTPIALSAGKTYIAIAPLDSTDGVNW